MPASLLHPLLQNVLLVKTPGEMPIAKLCDFGYSKSLQESAPMTRVGTLQYIGRRQLAMCADSLGYPPDGEQAIHMTDTHARAYPRLQRPRSSQPITSMHTAASRRTPGAWACFCTSCSSPCIHSKAAAAVAATSALESCRQCARFRCVWRGGTRREGSACRSRGAPSLAMVQQVPPKACRPCAT